MKEMYDYLDIYDERRISKKEGYFKTHYQMMFVDTDISDVLDCSIGTGEYKYFLRITKPVLFDIAIESLNAHVFLQNQNFPVPTIIYTKDNSPSIQVNYEEGEHLFILYEFIKGKEVDQEQVVEEIGELVGIFHSVMKNYSGTLIKQDKYYYVDKYLDQMRLKQYPRVDEFAAYGNSLWEKVKDLPRGYCHGDLYSGDIHKDSDGKLCIVDFDTSCEGFPMYDPVVI